jgi:plasmid replication initiation protein
VDGREILAVSPLYFDLTSGLDRHLYRLGRRHAGNGRDNPDGWAFSFRDLHGRSGSTAAYGQFARDLRKAIARNRLPDYDLMEEAGANGPLLRIRHRRMRL